MVRTSTAFLSKERVSESIFLYQFPRMSKIVKTLTALLLRILMHAFDSIKVSLLIKSLLRLTRLYFYVPR